MTLPTVELDAPTFTEGPAADLFSSYVTVAAVSAAHELGFLDKLQEDGYLSPAADTTLDQRLCRELLRTLAWAGVTRPDGDVVRQGPRFAEVYAARGYFYWLVRGCGELFAVTPSVAATQNRVGSFYHRDMRAVAIGSRLIGDTEVEPLFDSLFDNYTFTAMADLGCGSGQRVLRVAGRKPGVRGVGVDIAPSAVALARSSADSAGLAGRVDIVEADVLNLPSRPEFAGVELITCVFMGHDFWPYDRCVKGLRDLRRAFPNVERLLLCDVVRTPGVPGDDTKIFTLGFELVHAIMGVYIPFEAEWLSAFEAAGWELVDLHRVTAPPNGLLFELRPANGAAR